MLGLTSHGDGDSAAITAEAVASLDGSSREVATSERASNSAGAETVLADGAGTRDDTCLGSTAAAAEGSSGGSTTGGGGRSSSGSISGRRGRSTTDDGAVGSGSVLGNGKGLEHSVGLLGGGVDGEGHALAAVVALLAEEPFGTS